MDKQNFLNGYEKFPLTTDALAFMQDQTEVAHKLTALAGPFLIITEPSSSGTGLVIVNGDLMPLTIGVGKEIASTIVVSKTEKSIDLGDGSFDDIVRIRYVASYGKVVKKGSNTTPYSISKFKTWKNLETLTAELEEAKKHLMPKGTIIDWYTDKPGGCCFANIPDGFVPCGRYMKCSSSDWAEQTGGKAIAEVHKFQNRYGTIEYGGGGSTFVQIKKVGDMTIPDLTDRFIVQAGGTYDQGKTGGADVVALTNANQIPPHRHVYVADSNALERDVTKEAGFLGMGRAESGNLANVSASGSGAGGSAYTSYAGGSTGRDGTSKIPEIEDVTVSAHENRPPYFALYKLIKVI